MKAATMQDELEDSLDTMLRSHLKRELDPHLGFAMRKFDRERTFSIGSSAGQSPWGSRIRFAAAAVVMLGIGVTGSILYRNLGSTGSSPIAESLPVSREIPFTEAVQSSWTQTYDGGTVMVDPQTPARMLRRVQYEKTEWKDASGKWQSRIDIPHEDVILVDIPKQ